MESGMDVLLRALIALPVLFLAAVGYDRFVAAWGRRGYLEGYTALAVAAGCAGVLLAALWVVWPLGSAARLAVAIAAGLFVPAGAPMLSGSIVRYVQARAAERRQLEDEALRSLR